MEETLKDRLLRQILKNQCCLLESADIIQREEPGGNVERRSKAIYELIKQSEEIHESYKLC